MNKNRMNLRLFENGVNIIDRSGAESLIPTQEANEIIQGTIAQSAVLSRGRKLANMTSKQYAVVLANATITVYNHRYDSLTHFDTWHRTVIENVHIYVNHKASAGDSGLNSAEVYKIRIPADVENADQYLPPEEYAKLEDLEEHWTIQTDDQIVLGEYAQEIERPADLKDVRLRHCKVLSWSDNRFGGLPHWRIEGE